MAFLFDNRRRCGEHLSRQMRGSSLVDCFTSFTMAQTTLVHEQLVNCRRDLKQIFNNG
jgi:hypothetical protein